MASYNDNVASDTPTSGSVKLAANLTKRPHPAAAAAAAADTAAAAADGVNHLLFCGCHSVIYDVS